MIPLHLAAFLGVLGPVPADASPSFVPLHAQRWRPSCPRLAGLVTALVVGVVFTGLSPSGRADDLDTSIRARLLEQNISPLTPLAPANPAKVELGRMLFFDNHLSGNQNISCASCHHPSLASGERADPALRNRW